MPSIPTRVVLDTSAYSRLRAGHPRVLDWVAGADIVYLPAIVLGELEAGFRIGRRYAENRAALDAFLQEPFVETVAVTRQVGTRYGELFAQLRRGGTPIPVNDIWIAAATIDAGGHLLSFDDHFDAIDGLAHTLLSAPT